MSLLEVVIALAGACSTAMVVAAMVLLTPSGTETSQEPPSVADARPHPVTSGTPAAATSAARTSAHPPVVGDGAMT